MIVTYLLAALAAPVVSAPEPRIEPASVSAPTPAPVGSATTDQRRYCFQTETINTRILRQECRTRVGWRREGVDVDRYIKR